MRLTERHRPADDDAERLRALRRRPGDPGRGPRALRGVRRRRPPRVRPRPRRPVPPRPRRGARATCWPSRRCSTPPTPASTGRPAPAPTSRRSSPLARLVEPKARQRPSRHRPSVPWRVSAVVTLSASQRASALSCRGRTGGRPGRAAPGRRPAAGTPPASRRARCACSVAAARSDDLEVEVQLHALLARLRRPHGRLVDLGLLHREVAHALAEVERPAVVGLRCRSARRALADQNCSSRPGSGASSTTPHQSLRSQRSVDRVLVVASAHQSSSVVASAVRSCGGAARRAPASRPGRAR